MRKVYCLLVIVLLFLLSCNKNSLELPVPDVTPVSKICYLNNIATVELIFKRSRADTLGNVSVEVKNLTSEPLKKLVIAIEMCATAPQTLVSCDRHTVIRVNEIAVNGSSTAELPFKINSLDASSINAGIISYEKLTNLFADIYQTSIAFIERQNRQGLGNANVNGVVYADGISRFRLQFRDSLFYTITGDIDTIPRFGLNSGFFYRAGNNTPFTALDTDTLNTASSYVDTSTQRKVIFRTRLQNRLPLVPGTDSVHTILFNLQRTL